MLIPIGFGETEKRMEWLLSTYHDLDQSVRLASIEVEIPMRYIYDGVVFEKPNDDPQA